MDLDELQSVRDRERQTDKLQQLRASFYADAGAFIQELRDQRDSAADRADDPFDAPEVSRLSDEIDTAEQTVEAIYEKRVGKIVKAASFAAADLPAEVDGMTAEEEALFDSLVSDIEENRGRVLDVLAGETDPGQVSTPPDASRQSAEDTPTDGSSLSTRESQSKEPSREGTGDRVSSTPPDGPGSSTDVPDPGVSAGDLMGDAAGSERGPDEPPDSSTGDDAPETGPSGGEAPETSPSGGDGPVRNDGGPETERVVRSTVRVTDDVGEILGVDGREYDLAEDDVVTLPTENAGPLVEQGAAERLE